MTARHEVAEWEQDLLTMIVPPNPMLPNPLGLPTRQTVRFWDRNWNEISANSIGKNLDACTLTAAVKARPHWWGYRTYGSQLGMMQHHYGRQPTIREATRWLLIKRLQSLAPWTLPGNQLNPPAWMSDTSWTINLSIWTKVWLDAQDHRQQLAQTVPHL